MNLANLLARAGRTHPTRAAVFLGNAEWCSNAGLAERAARIKFLTNQRIVPAEQGKGTQYAT